MLLRGRRKFLAALAAMPVIISGKAIATEFPERPIRIIVPYTPGGSVDPLARVLAEHMRKVFGQPVIVDNKPGANTAIGAQATATSPPDGYTLLLGTGSTYVVNSFLYSKLPYNPERDFAPVALVAVSPLVLVTSPNMPTKSVQELVAMARVQPRKVNYASTGQGSIMQLAALRLSEAAGMEMTHIPYKGSAPALAATMSGEVQMFMDALGSALPLIKGGKLRALAVLNNERVSALPNVPTMAESGFTDFNVSAWYGIAAPARTPPEIVAKLNAVINDAMANREVRERIEALGLTLPKKSDPTAFGAFIKSEREHWGPIIKSNKLIIE